jgi:hypothetical protein
VAQPSSYTNGYRVFPEAITAGSWRWPPIPSSAEVKERVKLYLYSTSEPSWSVIGWTLTLPLHFLWYGKHKGEESPRTSVEKRIIFMQSFLQVSTLNAKSITACLSARMFHLVAKRMRNLNIKDIGKFIISQKPPADWGILAFTTVQLRSIAVHEILFMETKIVHSNTTKVYFNPLNFPHTHAKYFGLNLGHPQACQYKAYIHVFPIACMFFVLTYLLVGIAQLVKRLATGWKVRGSNSGECEISRSVQAGPGTHSASCTMGTG